MTRIHRISSTRIATCLLLSCAAVASPALARAAEPDNAAEKAQSSGLGDIVVTAQRREERLQDVPIAVTAISSEMVQNAQIQNVTDIGTIAPNVFAVAQPGGNSIPQTTIRGLSAGTTTSPLVDNGVSYYIDGVYLGTILGALFDLADIERIEIIRGPAGTLFGTNATGGAINYITSGPKGKLGFRQDVTVGRFGELRTKTRVDLLEWHGLALSASYLHSERGSDVKNRLITHVDYGPSTGGQVGVLTSARKLGTSNTEAIHFAARYSGIAGLTVDYRFDKTSEKQVAGAAQVLGFSNGAGGAGALGIVQAQPFFGGPDYDDLVSAKRLTHVYNDATTPSKIRTRAHNLIAEYNASDVLTIKNITSWRHAIRGPQANQIDGAGGLVVSGEPFRILTVGGHAGTNQFSNETQFIVDTKPLNLTAGLFYYNRRTISGLAPVPFLVFASLPGDVAPGAPPNAFDLTSFGRSRQYAAYGQGTYHLNDQIDLTAGIRYTQDSKTLFSTAGGPPGNTFTYDKGKVTYLVNLAYKPHDGLLAYLKYSTGYIAGGFVEGPVVTDPVTKARIQGAPIPYAPETASSIEGGLKADWLDRRLRTNIALFHVKYGNLQAPVFGPICIDVPSGGCVTTTTGSVINAGKSHAYGAEIEMTALPVDALTLTANLGYTHFEYDRLDPSVGNVDTYRPSFRPKLNANLSAQYDFPEFSWNGRFSVRAEVNYRSAMNLSNKAYVETYNEYLNDVTRTGSLWLVNARATLSDIPVGPTTGRISVWGRNLLNKRPLLYAADLGTTVAGNFQEPLSFGADFTVEF